MAFEFMLLAAQAAGYATDMYHRKQTEKYTRQGEALDRQQVQLQMQQELLSSSEKALFNSEQLREVLASQRALAAARGQSSGVGSNLASAESATRAYNADELARQLSLTFRKHQVESALGLRSINKGARNSERRNQQFLKSINMLNVNEGLLKNLTTKLSLS